MNATRMWTFYSVTRACSRLLLLFFILRNDIVSQLLEYIVMGELPCKLENCLLFRSASANMSSLLPDAADADRSVFGSS